MNIPVLSLCLVVSVRPKIRRKVAECIKKYNMDQACFTSAVKKQSLSGTGRVLKMLDGLLLHCGVG